MIAPVIRSNTLITLVGGASVDPEDLEWALSRAPCLVAADGGAASAIASGHIPQAVIGDMDSVHDSLRNSLPSDRLHHVAEQDSTDFEKCLQRIEAPGILGLGFLGARVDHTLAALACLVRRRTRCLLVGPDDIAFVAPDELSLDLPVGTRFSLFPFQATTGRSTGLRWPIGGLKFAPWGQIGTSNEVTGPVTLTAPGLCVLLPRDVRDLVVPRLFAAP